MTVSTQYQKHYYSRKSIFGFGAAIVLALATASTISVIATSEASAKQFCIEYNGNRVCGGGWGRDRDRDDRYDRPIWRKPTPATLPPALRTNEREDVISVSGRPGNGKGKVKVCLKTQRGMWKKRLYLQRQGLNSENGHKDCDVFATGKVQIKLIKAKFAGKLEPVGITRLDLRGWGGGTVNILWIRD